MQVTVKALETGKQARGRTRLDIALVAIRKIAKQITVPGIKQCLVARLAKPFSENLQVTTITVERIA